MAPDPGLAALLAGKKGPVEYDYRLWRSNLQGNLSEELGTVDGATVSLSNFRDHTWELSLSMRDAQQLELFGGYARLEILVRDGSSWRVFPKGLYRFDFPKGSDTPLSRNLSLTGKSPEILLTEDGAFQSGYVVYAGSWILNAVRQILLDRGIPANRIDFPVLNQSPTDKQLTSTAYFDPLQDAAGCYWLRICNSLLASGGFYALWCDAEGRFTTEEIEDSSARLPDVSYGTQDPHERLIVGEIGWEYGDEEFANRVVVYGGDPNQSPPIVGIAENRDPDSRVSITSLFGRVVQKDPFVEQTIATSVEALKLARARLRISSGLDEKLTVPTVPDPRRGPRETYHLDVRSESGRVLWRGPYRVVGWTLPLDLSAMTHEVHREVRL